MAASVEGMVPLSLLPVSTSENRLLMLPSAAGSEPDSCGAAGLGMLGGRPVPE